MSEQFICCTCKQKITSGDYLQLGENYYHTPHFWCFICSISKVLQKISSVLEKLLENEDFSEHEGKVYCEEHYLEVTGAPKCMKCFEYMIGEYCIVQGKKFHPDCFKCDYCKRAFPSIYLKSLFIL